MDLSIDTVIRNASVVTPMGVVDGDLAIAGEQIISVGDPLPPEQSASAEVIDAAGHVVLPGGVDVHAHIEQMSGMGLWNADTFETATRSAIMGGTTTVISFAAQARGERLADTMAAYQARAQRGAMIDHAFHLTITDPSVDGFDDDLASLIAAGHRSLKVFTTYDIQLSDAALLRIFRAARAHGALVCVHAENDAIIADARAQLLAQGRTRPLDHAASRPPAAEIEAVARICRFAEYLDQPVMLFHISTAESVDIIQSARAAGVPVWAETCPHYLLMTEEVLDRPELEGAKWMCSPPQRSVMDQSALWSGLADGVLDLVSSDHAPYRFDETGKLSAGPDAGFHQIANGLPGLETRMPLMFDAMVSQGMGDLRQFARLTATAPAQIYGLQTKGAIAPGMDADLVIWDPEPTRTYGDNDLHDNVGYNPWTGRNIRGAPVRVLLRGRTVMKDGQCLTSPGDGRWIDRPTLATRPMGLDEDPTA